MSFRLFLYRALQVSCAAIVLNGTATFAADEKFTPPASPRVTFNFNPGWKFIKQDVPGAEAVAFDDSKWDAVSTPHTYNDIDSYDEIISHSHGENTEYMGIAWYRKHFKLPASAQGGKVFIEFEGMKQAGRFFVNGQSAGKFENGITACGLDITSLVKFGGQENVIAVKVDNSNDYKEEATGTEYQWMGRAFDPNYGGLNHNIWLHLTGKIYQTLPLYENLQTTGIYIYPTKFSISNKTCDVNVESQVKNEGDQQVVTLSVAVVDRDGIVRATFKAEESDMVAGQIDSITATGHLANAHWWDASDPYLYDVYTMLTVDGKVVDVCKTTTGFRKVELKGGAGKGGVYVNDRFVYLKGYAQRSTNDWAGLGQAYPDWMHDYNASLIRESNANYVRWMHISPQAVDERSFDKYGIVNVCPAGDKEGDAQGRQWDQRLEVMRDSMIYMRNHPSILFWEAGNNGVSGEHMKQMLDLRKQWDPNGGRAMGCRDIKPDAEPYAEYYGIMIGQDDAKDKRKTPTDLFRTYSEARRDKLPYLEAEDFREEAARRFWDDYSPPSFGFKPGPKDTYGLNSETFCVGRPASSDKKYASDGAIKRYYDYYSNRISNTDPKHSKWAAYASIYWSDCNADGRQDSSECCRVSGKVDSVRLPKQAFYAYRVMQNEQPDIHIIGHWTYPAGTKKTMYVVSNCESVELFINNRSKGTAKPTNGYLFTFPDIAWEPGVIKAVGISKGKKFTDSIETAGTPKSIRLTPMVGPKGLQANGSDVALIDFEVVDAKGRRCPTDEARVDFKVTGPVVWRGGYNSGIPGSTNNLYLNTECGINRVSVRSTLTPGTITVTATRAGLTSGTVEIKSLPVEIKDGLAEEMPQTLPHP
jgi:beta-galactosidase